MYALRLKTKDGWGKAEAFPDSDAARAEIKRNPAWRQYMIARHHPEGPFVPGAVPRCITLVIDSASLEMTGPPKDFWNPEEVAAVAQSARAA